MGSKLIATIGIGLTIVGILLLFWCGAPFPPRRRGRKVRALEEIDMRAVGRERMLDLGSWTGLIFSVVGAALQIWATWI